MENQAYTNPYEINPVDTSKFEMVEGFMGYVLMYKTDNYTPAEEKRAIDYQQKLNTKAPKKPSYIPDMSEYDKGKKELIRKFDEIGKHGYQHKWDRIRVQIENLKKSGIMS